MIYLAWFLVVLAPTLVALFLIVGAVANEEFREIVMAACVFALVIGLFAGFFWGLGYINGHRHPTSHPATQLENQSGK